MTDALGQMFDELLPAELPAPRAFTAYAPSNIALSKYWGKRDAGLNLPLNSSLSISLGHWGSETRVGPATDGVDRVWLNGQELSPDQAFATKVFRFVDLFRRGADLPVHIVTENSIPTAAGLASSASGFAALTLALAGAFGLDLSKAQLSRIARVGSGSASRSLWHGFVRWDKGTKPDGSDSHARPIDITWPEFRIAIVPVDTGPKLKSSRDGMNHTVETSPLFANWPTQAETDCNAMETHVLMRDFAQLGPLAEANALAMHATMMAARPSLNYLKPESWAVLERLWLAREQGLAAYATMDAGANVKLLFLDQSTDDLTSIYPQIQIFSPFDYQSENASKGA